MVDRITESLDSPAMLAFEDLQWADDLSLEIVAELARRIRDRPVLLVGAYRTDELPTDTILREWRARLLTQRIAEEARLAPLTFDQTALMTTLILATGLPASREVVSAVYERTDGIPLHIEELLGAIGDEARSDGRAIREATVPATIEDAVLARFERLSPEGRAVAQAGAVIGRCFVPEILAGIMDLPPDALEAPLRELVDQAFLDPPGPLRGVFGLPAPTAQGRALSEHSAECPPSLPRPGGRVRGPARGRLGDPCLGPFRASWSSRPGVQGGCVWRPGGREALVPS